MSDTTDQDVVDTSVSDEVDTSTNEEAQDTDTDLEDMEISFEDGEETEESDESEEEEPASESDKEEEEESAEDVESNDSKETEEEDTTSEEQGPSEEEIKRHNAEMAQRRIAEREARERLKEEAQKEYLEAAEDDKDLALRQLQIDAYNNKIESNSNKLQNGIDKAVANIDLFTKGSPEVKEELARSLDDFERMYVRYDQNGDPIEVKGDVFQYLQDKADSIKRLTGVGARQQIKDKSKTTARTQTPPSRAPKQPKSDPDIDAFDEEANRW